MTHLTFVAHTHWDREWYQPFEVFRAQLVDVLDEAIDALERDERLVFTLDGQVQIVDDYLEMRPDAEARIRALIESGRLLIGPWLTAADTLLADGECVIRNLARGIARAEALGGALKVGYVPDQFGHAAQLPQIFKMFGIESAALWRGVGPERPPHAFTWSAPDGSRVTTTWLQDGYATGRLLPTTPHGFSDAIERALERHAEWLVGGPLLVPVGDDHVPLARWLPDAVEMLRKRRPDLSLTVGSYGDHLSRLGEVGHEVTGELRSPAFAPVLAGVASARIREKQANWWASTLLQRYAEPLEAWMAMAGGRSRRHLVDRAWHQLLLNHGHDSLGGCGADEAHQDVAARYRWAAQLATLARDHALGSLETAMPAAAHACLAFNPGPSSPVLQVEIEVPRSLPTPLVSKGPDGTSWPVQELGDTEEPPLFEGELSTEEIEGYLGGLDPRAPLFGQFIRGIAVRQESETTLRLDVGLAETPAPDDALVEDQRRVEAMLEKAQRVHVVLHKDGVTRRVLAAASSAPQFGIVPIGIDAGQADAEGPRAGRIEDERVGITNGALEVVADPDGRVWIGSRELGPDARVCANDLVDEGDRGDLYHFEATEGAPIRAVDATATVIEEGPLRARLRVVQELELPVGLASDRGLRSEETRTVRVTTDVGLHAGQSVVDVVTTLDNQVRDHRLRALVHLPFTATRLDVDHGGAVSARPIDTAVLGSGTERPAPTGQHHGFVDASDGERGVAVFTRGLPEHELVRTGAGEALAVTLLRGVGWLARGDLDAVDHAVGPMVPTPAAQELGEHRFEYAIYLHTGDWRRGDVLRQSRVWQAPPVAFVPKQERTCMVPGGTPLVDVAPASVCVTAVHPGREPGTLVLRVLQASDEQVEARIRLAQHVSKAMLVDPCERPIAGGEGVSCADGNVVVSLAPWQWKTILVG